MAGQKYGWQDRVGGVEPGFASVQPAIFNTPLFRNAHDDADDAEQANGGVWASMASTRDDEWLRNLLE